MVFSSSFQFESEQQCTGKFVIPLLTRWGYVRVLNAHGATEALGCRNSPDADERDGLFYRWYLSRCERNGIAEGFF